MTALILCGGAGTRMGTMTLCKAKPMIPVLGRPIVQYVVCQLDLARIDSICAAVAYRKEEVKSYLSNLDEEIATLEFEVGDNISYVVTRSLLAIETEHLLVVDGDSLFIHTSIQNLVERHLASSTSATILLTSTPSYVAESKSFWRYQQSDGELSDLALTGSFSGFVRMATIVRRNQLLELVRHCSVLTRKEGEFVPGYENYLLGWNLLFKLMLDYSHKIGVVAGEYPFLNVNTRGALAVAERFVRYWLT